MARRQIVLSLLRRWLKPAAQDNAKLTIVDIGTGCGATLAELSRHYQAVGLDTSIEAVEYARSRGCTVVQGTLPDDVPFGAGQFDAVLALDVIEHVVDDQAAVSAMARLLKPGGILMATVPAYQWLWTKRDEYHEHKRRYSASEFRGVLIAADLTIELFTHFNSLLFLPALLERMTKKLLRLDRAEPDVTVPPAPLNVAMRWVFGLEGHLIPLVQLPVGLSLLAVARRPACATAVAGRH